MRKFGRLLSEKIDSIINSWVEIVQQTKQIDTADNLSQTAIRDHIPDILEAVVNLLSHFQEDSDVKSLVQNSLRHGYLRAAQGFEPTEIAQEYNLLKSVIVSTLKSELLISSSTEIIQFFHLIDCTLNEALSQCFKSYTEERLRELQELNHVKDEFLNTVSHELRTPITNMKLAIRMLKVAPAEEQIKKQYLKILEAECERESDLINNLLDLQRLEASSYSLSPETIILQEWLPAIIQPFRVRTQADQQILHISLPSSVISITVDCSCLRRILVELLNNACKYTPAGGEISLSIYQNQSPTETTLNHTARTVFIVANQASIPDAELPRIFEKFYRGHNTNYSSKQSGTGLGLALVKQLVEQMQGIIQVESSNQWTTFTIELPNQPNP